MKKAGKVLFWVAMGFLVVAIVFLSLLIGDLGTGLNWAFGITGLLSVLIALIALTISAVLFLKDDDAHNRAESADDALKAH